MLKKQVQEEKFIKTNWRKDEKNIITISINIFNIINYL